MAATAHPNPTTLDPGDRASRRSLWSLLAPELNQDRRRAELVTRVMAGFALLLIAATWRLWIPRHDFPQVPLVYAAVALPEWCQWLALGTMLLGLATSAAVAGSSRWNARGLTLFVASAVILALCDQARLQPWLDQFLLIALLVLLAGPRVAVGLLRVLIISFYFYSAVTKLDSAFLHTVGQQFLDALASRFGIAADEWSPTARQCLAAVFPLAEMLWAIGLCFRRTRMLALSTAVLTHIVLILILGPWGLNHQPAVLLWNAYFIAQDLLLFAATRPTDIVEPQSAASRSLRAAHGLVIAAVLLPLLAPSGWFDLWPSWGLYAASAERVTLWIHRREVSSLPSALRPFAEESTDVDNPWVALRLDRWSLGALSAPIYPQSRYQLGVAAAVVDFCQLGNRARAVRYQQSDRWTGERAYDMLDGQSQITAAARDYWLNARPNLRAFQPSQ